MLLVFFMEQEGLLTKEKLKHFVDLVMIHYV